MNINELKIDDKVSFKDLSCAFALHSNITYSRYTKVSIISYVSSDYVITDFDGYFLVLNYDKIIKIE